MKSRDRLLKILAGLAAVVIVIFFAAEMYSIANKNFTTQTVYEQTVLETVDAKMYIIRDETPLTANATGVTVPLAKNGERVSKGSVIAAVFPSESSAENYIKVESLELKLEAYKKVNGQLKLANVDIGKLGAFIAHYYFSQRVRGRIVSCRTVNSCGFRIPRRIQNARTIHRPINFRIYVFLMGEIFFFLP